jgi:NAD+ kinase
MNHNMSTRRVCLVGNPNKPDAPPAFDRIRKWLIGRGVQVVGGVDRQAATHLAESHDMVIVLGGDGTILTTAGLLGGCQSPIVGVNLGKLGYLAEFTVEDFEKHGERLLADASLVSQRMMLDVEIHTSGRPVRRRFAFNDCVIHAGQPFRMIELAVRLDGQDVTHITGDGLIVATPTGSTAHNLSAGGPILQPDVQAAILTPICPHSLTHRPIVVGPDAVIEVSPLRTNEGTAAVIDGQQSQPLSVGGRVLARRAAETFRLVRHPDRPAWKTLIRKLSWGRPPGR